MKRGGSSACGSSHFASSVPASFSPALLITPNPSKGFMIAASNRYFRAVIKPATNVLCPDLLALPFICLISRVCLLFFPLPLVFPGLLAALVSAVMLIFYAWISAAETSAAGASKSYRLHMFLPGLVNDIWRRTKRKNKEKNRRIFRD